MISQVWLVMAAVGAAAVEGAGPEPGGARDFDFLVEHRWRVHNRVLAARLAGSTEWREFEATLQDGMQIARGRGNVDRFVAVRDGEPFEGNSLRLFDPKTGEWTIYWIDSRDPVPRFQVRGHFEGDVGTFYGEDDFQGREVRLRFLWKIVSDRTARWEQAYWDEAAGDWETNWVMEFERTD
jgi:hypothetical protein